MNCLCQLKNYRKNGEGVNCLCQLSSKKGWIVWGVNHLEKWQRVNCLRGELPVSRKQSTENKYIRKTDISKFIQTFWRFETFGVGLYVIHSLYCLHFRINSISSTQLLKKYEKNANNLPTNFRSCFCLMCDFFVCAYLPSGGYFPWVHFSTHSHNFLKARKIQNTGKGQRNCVWLLMS